MVAPDFDPEMAAQQLGAGGIDNLVANAERMCGYQQRHIELTNQGPLIALKEELNHVCDEEQQIEALLLSAPPSGDLRLLRRRAIYCWALTIVLTLSGLAFTLLTLAPFRMGWISWPFAIGIASLTPFLVEKLLEKSRVLITVLNALATVAAVAGLMLLAEVRGNLLEQQLRQSQDQAVIIDDAQPSIDSDNTFYEKSNRMLQLAMLFLAFSMEAGAGLALRETWRSSPNSSEDWKVLRRELVQVRRQKSAIIGTMVDLRNAPSIFVTRFWRDFYRAMLSNAVRTAMTRLLVTILAIFLCALARAEADSQLDLVIAIDLTQSVAVTGPDGKSEFEKNVDGVSRMLAQVPAGTRVTVIGITDHSFSQPYILMRARVGADPGYFGERLAGAKSQLARSWKFRGARLKPDFRSSDILGALGLAQQIFADRRDAPRRMLVVLSDMRQNTRELNLESPTAVPAFATVAGRCSPIADLRGVHIFVLGATGAGWSAGHWRELESFWVEYFRRAGGDLRTYSVFRELFDRH
jgi:hypothetical protein